MKLTAVKRGNKSLGQQLSLLLQGARQVAQEPPRAAPITSPACDLSWSYIVGQFGSQVKVYSVV